jgi:uncharacterized small protein (DUF1192 family)
MEKMTMQANKRIVLFLILSALTFLLAGCPAIEEPLEVILKPDPAKHKNSAMSKRFQETAPKGQSAIDSVMELSKRCAILSEEKAVLRQKNLDLSAENHQLKDRIATLEPELTQTKRELTEANDLLIEMRIELNNWKTDILGFRDEIRDADTEQLRALLKILEILGGEVKTGPSQEQDKDSATASPNEQSKPQLNETPTLSEPNE